MINRARWIGVIAALAEIVQEDVLALGTQLIGEIKHIEVIARGLSVRSTAKT
jgi:hypothetical protein